MKGTFSKRLLIPALLLIAGISVILYPVVKNICGDYRLAALSYKFYREFSYSSLEKDSLFNEALKDNREEDFEIANDPWQGSGRETVNHSTSIEKYVNSQQGLLSVVNVPALGIALPVYEGTGETVLARGAGHLVGTALPVGGVGTRSVIAAHTAYSGASMFDNLINAENGMIIIIHTLGHDLYYKIDSIEVIDPNDVDKIRPVSGQDIVTLLTCTPFGKNTHRLLVSGSRFFPSGNSSEINPYNNSETAFIPGYRLMIQSWMWIPLALSGLTILILVVVGMKSILGSSAKRRIVNAGESCGL
ncbi:class C sortase [Corynebacterium poyangense]|uniref:Class C sortase n=1 Tax=Corynebacterium poyangense TaxID=2684405 RepID=A0A7H0SLQ6_9CORY|nr:class C sortase [Corynebacterium poyangense]QNQ89481.1 class C sortase [Corynebacterium poyangense]